MEQNFALALAILTSTVSLGAWLRSRARLNALRSNAWLTDERGHRRRYADCSEAVRAKAETN